MDSRDPDHADFGEPDSRFDGGDTRDGLDSHAQSDSRNQNQKNDAAGQNVEHAQLAQRDETVHSVGAVPAIAESESESGDAVVVANIAAPEAGSEDPAARNSEPRTGETSESLASDDMPVSPDPPQPPAPTSPRFLHRSDASPLKPGRTWITPSAVAALALLLALQLLLSQRDELAAAARWRPWVVTTCRVFRCSIPVWREPATLVILGRNVRPDANQPGVLQVTATVRNDAHWPQPLPLVVLSLSDADGRVLAARNTLPGDYSPRPTALIAPGDSVDITFAVREPLARVDAFDFALR